MGIVTFVRITIPVVLDESNKASVLLGGNKKAEGASSAPKHRSPQDGTDYSDSF